MQSAHKSWTDPIFAVLTQPSLKREASGIMYLQYKGGRYRSKTLKILQYAMV